MSWLLASLLFLFGLFTSACGGSKGGGGGGGGNTPVLQSLAITPPSVSLAKGFPTSLVATGTYSDMTTRDLTTEVQWSSADPAVATVGSDVATCGQVATLTVGTVQITAIDAATGVSATASVVVTPAELVEITVTPQSASLALGYTRQFTATGRFSDNTTQDLTTAVTWTSSSAAATVGNGAGTHGLATAAAVGTTTLTATHAASGLSGLTFLTVTAAELVSIALTPPSPSIALGLAQQFTATGTFSDNTTQDVTGSVVWSSSDPSVATVGNTAGTRGHASSVAAGVTTITAANAGGAIAASTTLTVTGVQLTSIAVTPSPTSVPAGLSRSFTATGTFSDNSTQDVTTLVTWSSASTAVATVSNAFGSQGRATGAGLGTTQIVATDPTTMIAGSGTLTVTTAVLVAIDVTPATPTISTGFTQQLTATGVYSDNSTQDLTSVVTWVSSDPSVATISNAAPTHGQVTGVAGGSAMILATGPGTFVTGGTTVTVSPAVLVSIDVTPAATSLALGYTQQFTATALFSDNSTQDVTASVTWSSSNTAAATISNAVGSRGLASTVGAGNTTITALDPGSSVSGSTSLLVTPAVLVSVDVTPVTPSLALGYEQQFTATGTFSDNSTQDITTTVTWSSSNPAAATISNASGSEGRATTQAIGVTTITATDAATSHAASTSFTVTPAVLASVALTPSAGSKALGYDQQFTATGTFSDNTTQDLTTSVTWSSSNTSAATVSNAVGTQGLVTTAGVGVTTIAVVHVESNLTASTTFTVDPAVLVAIDLTPIAASVALGYPVQYAATGTYSDNTTQDVTTSVTWTSSDPTKAVISNASGSHGLATTLAAGATTIAAIDPTTSVNASTSLTVTPAVLVSIAVTPAASTLSLGSTRQFTATGTFSDNTTMDMTTTVTWSSSDTAKVAISNASGSEGLATALATGSVTVTATEPGSNLAGSTSLVVTAASLVSIGVTTTSTSAALGYSRQFTATGTYSDNSTADLTGAVTWSSSNPAVATISNASGSEGLATTAATGNTTITAVDPGTNISGSVVLTVTPAVLVSVAVTPASPSAALGTTRQFTATGTFSDNTTQDLTAVVAWSSSTLAVATISNASGSQGLATTASTGGTTITATDPGSSLAGTATLTVTPAVLVSIAVSPSSPSVALGQTRQFTAIGTYSDSSTQDLTTAVTWSSSNPSKATISNASGSQGLATTVATGTTTISATDPATSVVGTSTLTVTPAVLVSIAVTPAAPTVALGLTQQFTATGTFSDLSTQDLTATVTWSSSNTGVATVSNAGASHGLASTVGTGSATITATDPATSVAGSTSLTVTSAVLVGISVSPTSPTVALGSNQQFTATGTYSDNSTQNLTTGVTWSSSNLAVATISNTSGSQGVATSVAQGSSTITATHPLGFQATTTLTVGNPIVLRQSSPATGASGALSLPVAVPTGTAAGDVMLAAITVRPSSATITAPAGWTLIRRSDNSPPNPSSLLIYRRVATGSEPADYAWTFSNSQGSAGCILAFQGVDNTTPIDVENGQATPSSLTHATPSVTTTTANTMVVTFHAMTSSVTWTPPAGMTEVVDIASAVVPTNGGMSLLACWQFQAVAGATGARTATASNNAGTGNACIVALRD